MIIQEPVQAAVWQCLNHYAFADAIFLAERLYAEVGSDDAVFLLATCYYRAGKAVRAYTLLKNKGCPTPQCKFLMAQCCLEINKLSEAEAIISGNILQRNKSVEDLVNEFGEMSCFALKLLARVYSKTERINKAAENYRRSLKLNPFLWTAFESLCQMGEKPDPLKTFQVTSQGVNTMCQLLSYSTPTSNNNVASVQSSAPPSAPSSQPTNPIVNNVPHIIAKEHTPVVPVNADPEHTTPQLSVAPSSNVMPQIITPATAPVPDVAMDTTPSNHTPLNTVAMLPPTAPKRPRGLAPKAMQGAKSLLGGPAAMSPLTPSFGVLPLDATPSPGMLGSNNNTPIVNLWNEYIHPDLPKAPAKKPMTRRSQQQHNVPKPPVFSQSGNTNTNTMRDVQTPSPQQSYQTANMPGLRRSSRLFSASSSSVKENSNSNSKNQNPKKFTQPKAPTKKLKSKTKTAQELNEINKSELMSDYKPSSETVTSTQAHVAHAQKQSAEGLMHLLQEMGKAYQALTQFECNKAIQLLNDLPMRHHNTGWVLSHKGRAYFEISEYQKAVQIFSEVRQLEPHHLEGMEYYSTALWHLEKEVQLSSLAQELTELDNNAPEAWCATGNCFSLQKEHDVAIKFFQRAVQVDPCFAYAYTLLGHEYVMTEELDKALACFRNAIRVDARLYNAWYGLGMVYYKQEKLSLAEIHFRKALAINPQSAALLCHIGVVQHALKKSDKALQTLDKAILTDPRNPLCKFHRASILFASDRHKEALTELEELKEIVPRESLVYFLIGKVHKKLGNTHLALMNFSWAMDLDPKGANNHIKEAIDKRYVTDEDDPATGAEEPSGLEDPIEASSNNSSLLEPDDVQLQAMESDESL